MVATTSTGATPAWAGLTLQPAIGAVLMSASTIFVALNAQPLRRPPTRHPGGSMMPARPLAAAIAVAGALLLGAACTRTTTSVTQHGATPVDIEMVDTAYNPTTLSVPHGRNITFRFTNHGKIPHDAFIGDRAAQAEHEQEMRSGGAHHGHGDEPAVTVDPGKTATLSHTFDRAGTTEIGCHQPGHYDAGMKITVTVT